MTPLLVLLSVVQFHSPEAACSVATHADRARLGIADAERAGEVDLKACQMRFNELKPMSVLVDVRSPAQREAAWVPISLQADLSKGEQLAAVRAEEIVLFGSGANDTSLVARCASLRNTSGRNFRVLIGGLRALVRGGIRVERAGGGEIDLLDDGELVQLFAQEDVRVIDLAGYTSERVSTLRARLAGKSSNSRGQEPLGAALPTVYLLPTGESASNWRRRLGIKSSVNAMFYNKDLVRFERYVHRRDAIARNAGRRLPSACEWNS